MIFLTNLGLAYDETTQQNGKGHLTRAENADAKTIYDYDNMGRMTKETTTVKALAKTFAINYTYNATNGGMASYSYPDGKAVTYTYDNNQRVKTMSYNGKLIVTYAYNTNGTIQTMAYGNNTQITYTYDKEVLLKNLTAVSPQNGQLYTQSYTYDSVGRATQTQLNDYFSSSGSLTRDYTYTPKNELKTVAINTSPTYTHNYDKNSNHLRFETQHNKGLSGDNMIIDPNTDRLIQKNYQDGKKIIFSYDPAGNMTQKNRLWSDGSQGPKLTYTYNYQDQISQANDTGYTVMTAGYDYKNQRVYTNMPGINPWNGQKFYYWNQNGAIIGEGKVGVNDYVVRYFYSGNEKIAMERYDQTSGTSSFYYFINNAQGTPVLIVDEQNNAISKINLDEWGNVGNKTTGPQQEINFTGKKMDLPTNLYYFNQRYYDPEIGRFINEDPAGQGMNHYAYCANNPISYTDPNGEFWFEFLALAGGAYGGLFGGTQEMINGGSFSKGFIKGWIDGVKIGGSIGIAADLCTGGWTTYSKQNPFFNMMMSSYAMAWQGQAGTGCSGEMGGGDQGNGTGGGHNRYSDYEDPGVYLPGSGPGHGFRPGTGDINSDYGWRFNHSEFHSGEDFSPGDGYAYARFSGFFDIPNPQKEGFGNHVIVNRDEYSEEYNLYGHLSVVFVQQGHFVHAGEPIGIIGNSGYSTGRHLHYGEFIIYNQRRRFYDPGI